MFLGEKEEGLQVAIGQQNTQLIKSALPCTPSELVDNIGW